MSPRRAAAAFCVAWVAVAVAARDGDAARAQGGAGAVAAEHRLASEAGVEILRGGGNAVDAAVAALLVGGVVNPSSSGLGGGGFMVVYLARDRALHTLDFREVAPARAHRDMFVRDGEVDSTASKRGGLAVAVPAEPMGLAHALRRFGTLTFAQAAAPAMRIAREGFAVEAHLASALERHRDELASDPELARYFLHDDGRPYREGETLRRPALAETLATLAAEGPDRFFEEPIARDIVAAAREAGGVIEVEDLAAYRVIERAPVVTGYRGLRVAGMGPPSSGGGTLATALEILEAHRLSDLGLETPTYLHLLAETLKAVFADRALFYGDPDFMTVPLQTLVSPRRGADIRRRLSATRTRAASAYGHGEPARGGGTAHVSVADADGNAVATTSSINTGFGAKIGVRGFVLNNTMDDFSLRPGSPNAYGLIGNEVNSIAPGKRPLSSMSPTLVLDPDGVRVVAGGSGGPLIISATLQALLATIDFGLDADAAVSAARIHHQWMPDVLVAEPRPSPDAVTTLRRLGHEVRVSPMPAAVSVVGRARAGDSTTWVAGSDDRKGGVPAAY